MYPSIEPLEDRRFLSVNNSGLIGLDQALAFVGLTRNSFHTNGVNWSSPTRDPIGRYSGQVDLTLHLRRTLHYTLPVSLTITNVLKDGTVKGKVSSPFGSYPFSQKALIPQSGDPITVTVDGANLSGSLTAQFTRGIGFNGTFQAQWHGRSAEGTFYLTRG